MTGRTHEAIGGVGLVAAAVLIDPPVAGLGWPTVIATLIANLVGTLLPDIDQASNRLWDMIPGGNTAGKMIKKVFRGHRTYSHSLLGIVVVFVTSDWVLSRLLNNNFVQVSMVQTGLLIGYILHLAADGLTEEGIPLLWPLGWKFGVPPWKSLRIRTGHFLENWIIFPGVIIWGGYLVWQNWERVLAII